MEDISEEDISELDISEEDILWHIWYYYWYKKTFTNFSKKLPRLSNYLLGLASFIMTQIIM